MLQLEQKFTSKRKAISDIFSNLLNQYLFYCLSRNREVHEEEEDILQCQYIIEKGLIEREYTATYITIVRDGTVSVH